MIRRVLEAVQRGELDEGGQRGAALTRRMEGAAVALEADVAEKPGPRAGAPAHGPA